MQGRTIAAADLSRMRFAVSPLWEAVASVRRIAADDLSFHATWCAEARRRVAAARLDMSLLYALVPPEGHIADFLTPTPRRRLSGFDTELAAVAAQPDARIRLDLETLLDASPTREASRLLDRGLADPTALRQRAVADLRAYWQLTVSTVWDRLRGLAQADITWRLEAMADGGTSRVLGTLHPRLRMSGTELLVLNSCGTGPATGGHGLVLVPCAFAWPGVLFFNVPDQAPTLTYAPRGVGALWRDEGDVADAALADLLGPKRAAALHLLDLPMTTTQLACHLDITAPSANSHLQILRRAGLVTRRRQGRIVLYARTGLGAALAAARPDHSID